LRHQVNIRTKNIHERTGFVKISRRRFLEGSAALGAAALNPLAKLTHASASPAASKERLAVTMWDFSWLTRRSAPEAEYAEFDHILDALTERGYNCIRMDAFPHLVGAGPDGKIQDKFVMLPQDKHFMWGNHEEVEIEPRKGLVEFMTKCRQRGIRVGLSSWFQPDKTSRVDMLKSPQDFSRVWMQTLEMIEDHGLLDIIEWVDLCNEFPLTAWAPGAVEYMSNKSGKKLPVMIGMYSREQKQVFSRFMQESIEPLKQRFPDLCFCFSFTEADADAFEGVDLSSFDVLEPHLWLNMNILFAILSGLWIPLSIVPNASYGVSAASTSWYRSLRGTWLEWMGKKMNNWARVAANWNCRLYTTEAWGPVIYEDLPAKFNDREWAWVKDIAGECVDMAIQKGWKGICTSNFCGPQHEGMWNDVDWHQEMTGKIRG
jgi:hypothetical protein